MERIFETHCHLNHQQFTEDLDGVIQRARDAGVGEMLVIGYDMPSSRSAVKLADPDAGLFAAAGIHPHDAESWSHDVEAELRDLLAQPGIAALGEIGLDFYRDLSPRDAQYRAFAAQMELALELRLPIVVHTRESVTASLDLMEPFAGAGLRGIMHCWSGTVEEARRARALGFTLGIGGVITYKKPGALIETVADTPLNELVLETDAPYLAPTPHRGKRNEPAYLPLIAERVASVKEVTTQEVCRVTGAAARALLVPATSEGD
ncbi:MAG: TatD family hydrolase [Actinomycetota bacterium]